MSERDAARDMLRELLAEALAGANGHGVTPAVPPPPVAAVLRPSTWTAPPAGGEVIGGAASAPPDAATPLGATPGAVERVALRSDADLDRFVRGLLARPPADLEAIRSGRLRFTLGGGGPAAPAGAIRVERGALTERKVQEAAKAGARLVLGPGAVVTPLAREKARALGIDIERER